MNKKIIWIILGVVVIFCALFVRIYKTSPGFTTREEAASFYFNASKCSGLSIPISNSSLADHPEKALCIGILIKGPFITTTDSSTPDQVDSDTYVYSRNGFSIQLPKGFVPQEEQSQTGPALSVSLPVGGLTYISNAPFWEQSNVPSYTYIKDQKFGDSIFKVYSYEGASVYWLNKGNAGYEFSVSEADKVKLENLLKTFKITSQ